MANISKEDLESWAQRFSNVIGAQDRQIKQLTIALNETREKLNVNAMRPRSIEDELNSIPGRRVPYMLTGKVAFDITALNTRGQPISFLVNADGPFIQTHYPVALWKPTSPVGATNLGHWRQVVSSNLPTQDIGTGVDIIDISYELIDGGSQRNLQNETSLPLFSRLDRPVALPVANQLAANSQLLFYPTYHAISFTGLVPPDRGELWVSIPGYRIVNM